MEHEKFRADRMMHVEAISNFLFHTIIGIRRVITAAPYGVTSQIAQLLIVEGFR